VKLADVALLVCSACRGALGFEGALAGDEMADGGLHCGGCGRDWPVEDGLPNFVDEAAVGGVERLMRFIYDHFAALHDPAVRVLTPLLQSISEQTGRERYMRRLELDRLAADGARTPLRILEVGVGSGGNIPFLERHLPPALEVDLWGLDLSAGMIAQCRRRLARHRGRPMRLLLGDAHALPFPDASFDRVFHTGGIASYRDPRRGLAEMARVARPGTPIVVVDEQLDPRAAHGLLHRLAFRAITFYDPAPACPVAHLPCEATGIVAEQVSRFYYCLTFRL
jgi:ubiquinone/menaquinone biosynthesis C-methylase UbiE/uncharacterized protein YbaR (Trm112 family)